MQELKKKLLSLGIFEDNEYLDFYCTLIDKNKDTKKEKFKTQKHHIIPKCYYKLNNLEIDNSDSNCVNLLYKDHILAHYYLCLCVDNNNKKLIYYFYNSFLHMIKADANNKIKINNFDTDDLNDYQNIYYEWKILNSELQKGSTAWNKGLTKETDGRVAKYAKPRHFSKEHNEHNRQSLIRYYKTHDGTMKGKHLSIESKIKISLANKGKSRKSKHPEITSKKLSEKTKNNWASNLERRQKLINYNKTRILSTETLSKMQKSQKRFRIQQFSSDNKPLKVFESINEASKVLSINTYRIKKSCDTNYRLKEGYYFKYL